MNQVSGQINFIILPNGRVKLSVRYRRPKKHPCHAPRTSWNEYGMTKERLKELQAICRGGEYAAVVYEEAERASEMLAPYIYKSVTENRSYEGVEYMDGHRIPCGRTDFYGYRRLMYANLDKRLKQGGF